MPRVNSQRNSTVGSDYRKHCCKGKDEGAENDRSFTPERRSEPFHPWNHLDISRFEEHSPTKLSYFERNSTVNKISPRQRHHQYLAHSLPNSA
jgi:hypothetical protein